MKNFLRTFSKKEIFSSLFAALMMVSMTLLLKSLNLLDSKYLSGSLVILGPVFLKHRFYLLEHKRRNRIMGRLTHNLITSLFIFILIGLSLNAVDKFHEIGNYPNLAIFSLFIIYFAEAILTIINQLLSRIFKVSLW